MIAKEAINQGASACAHIFNAMPAISAREPTATTVFLTDDSVFTELVADGVHVAPEVIELVLKTKPDDKIVLISDSTPPSGTHEKKWELEGKTVEIRGLTGYLPNGTIAGSALTISGALSVLFGLGLISVEQAVRISASNPSSLLNLEEKVGFLRTGCFADFNVISLNPSYQLHATYLGGVKVKQ